MSYDEVSLAGRTLSDRCTYSGDVAGLSSGAEGIGDEEHPFCGRRPSIDIKT